MPGHRPIRGPGGGRAPARVPAPGTGRRCDRLLGRGRSGPGPVPGDHRPDGRSCPADDGQHVAGGPAGARPRPSPDGRSREREPGVGPGRGQHSVGHRLDVVPPTPRRTDDPATSPTRSRRARERPGRATACSAPSRRRTSRPAPSPSPADPARRRPPGNPGRGRSRRPVAATRVGAPRRSRRGPCRADRRSRPRYGRPPGPGPELLLDPRPALREEQPERRVHADHVAHAPLGHLPRHTEARP